MPKRASINIRGLRKEVGKKSGTFIRKTISNKATQAARLAKEYILNLFDSHPITQEIEGGSSASNKSGTLGGVGNLFTYIGFEEGSRPTVVIRKYLEDAIQVKAVKKGNKDLSFVIEFQFPSQEQIDRLAPVPWAPGRSWVRAMELGLSGLGQYLFKNSSVSRSGGAIQVKGQVGQGRFANESYMSSILKQVEGHIKRELQQ